MGLASVRGGRWLERILPDGTTPQEKRLLATHLAAAFLTGLCMGILFLADAIVAKTLEASALAVTTINILMGAGFLASLFWGGAMRHRPKAPFIIGAAVVGRLALALTGAWVNTAWYVAMVGLAWFAQAMIVTAQASIVRQAYAPERRDQLFGISISVASLARLLATVGGGWILDWNEETYRLIFVGAGVAGFGGALLLARLERQAAPQGTSAAGARPYRPLQEPSWGAGWRGAKESARLVLRILREDRDFRRFEGNFFIYGIAFLALMPIVPIFLVHDLQLDYARIGLARGLMVQAGVILLSPVLGRVMRATGPVRFCGSIFGVLALYPALLFLSATAAGTAQIGLVYSAFLAFGLAMAGVSLAWNLSSIHFSGEEDPSAYQAVHSVLVGLRGVSAPVLGYLVIQIGSARLGFVLTAALFALAALRMARMARSYRPRPQSKGN